MPQLTLKVDQAKVTNFSAFSERFAYKLNERKYFEIFLNMYNMIKRKNLIEISLLKMWEKFSTSVAAQPL